MEVLAQSSGKGAVCLWLNSAQVAYSGAWICAAKLQQKVPLRYQRVHLLSPPHCISFPGPATLFLWRQQLKLSCFEGWLSQLPGLMLILEQGSPRGQNRPSITPSISPSLPPSLLRAQGVVPGSGWPLVVMGRLEPALGAAWSMEGQLLSSQACPVSCCHKTSTEGRKKMPLFRFYMNMIQIISWETPIISP